MRYALRRELLTAPAPPDAELGQVEHPLLTDSDPVAGSCPQCGTPHARAALLFGKCGSPLTPGGEAVAP